MKKFTINCDFGGQAAPFAVYIGTPEGGHHPLHFQAEWLSKNRGGSIPPDIMEAVGKLKELADKNGVSLEELCVYALGAAQQERDEEASNLGGQPGDNYQEETQILDETSENEESEFDFDDLVMTPSNSAEGEENINNDDDDLSLQELTESNENIAPLPKVAETSPNEAPDLEKEQTTKTAKSSKANKLEEEPK